MAQYPPSRKYKPDSYYEGWPLNEAPSSITRMIPIIPNDHPMEPSQNPGLVIVPEEVYRGKAAYDPEVPRDENDEPIRTLLIPENCNNPPDYYYSGGGEMITEKMLKTLKQEPILGYSFQPVRVLRRETNSEISLKYYNFKRPSIFINPIHEDVVERFFKEKHGEGDNRFKSIWYFYYDEKKVKDYGLLPIPIGGGLGHYISRSMSEKIKAQSLTGMMFQDPPQIIFSMYELDLFNLAQKG